MRKVFANKKIIGVVIFIGFCVSLISGGYSMFLMESFDIANDSYESSNCGWSRAHATIDPDLGHALLCSVKKLFNSDSLGSDSSESPLSEGVVSKH